MALLLVAAAVVVGVPTVLPWPLVFPAEKRVRLDDVVEVKWLQPRQWLSRRALWAASAPRNDSMPGIEWTLWAHSEMRPTWGATEDRALRYDILSVRVSRHPDDEQAQWKGETKPPGSNKAVNAVWLPLLWSTRARRYCRLECAVWPRVSCDPAARITSGRLPRAALELTDHYITTEVERDNIEPGLETGDTTVPVQCLARAAIELGRGYDVQGDWSSAARWYHAAVAENATRAHAQERWYARYRYAVMLLRGGTKVAENDKSSESGEKIRTDKEASTASRLHDVERAFLAAIETPGGERRREPYYYLARMWREADVPRRAAIYATAGLHLPSLTVADQRYALYIERPMAADPPDASWPLKEELALARYYSGDYASAAALYAELVDQAVAQSFSAHHLRRFRIGLAHAESHVGE